MDDVEIVDEEDAGDAFAAYYADESKTGDREPGKTLWVLVCPVPSVVGKTLHGLATDRSESC